jgi:hypothetical protein
MCHGLVLVTTALALLGCHGAPFTKAKPPQ